MTAPPAHAGTVADELSLLQSLLPLRDLAVIELGCGAAELARRLLAAGSGCRITALEVDARQHAKNLLQPAAGLVFVQAGAEAIPFGDACFDLALMLKSLHHVAVDRMDAALAEVRRVLRTDALLYVSEPVFGGDLNQIIRLFHDEQAVRAAAQAALQRALAGGGWARVAEFGFDAPVAYRDFADFEQRMIGVTFAEHRLDEATRAAVRQGFSAHLGHDGARFLRPMQVQLLRRLG
jgi:SAM-dependent methyltransferase